MPRPTADSTALAVNDVLYEHWDPIGLRGTTAPRTEYEGYVPELIALARATNSAEVIAQRLSYLADQIIGAEIGPEFHQLDVARRILAIVGKESYGPAVR
jgi:hypothetical protein